MRRTGHTQHVVDAHEGIGNDDGAHRTPEGGDHGAVVMAAALVSEQLVGNPQKPQAADQHESRNLQQPDHAHRHDRAHHDGADGAPDDGFALQCRRQVARSQRNHDGVVACQNQIDENDGQQRRPPGSRKKFHIRLSHTVEKTQDMGGDCVQALDHAMRHQVEGLTRPTRAGVGPTNREQMLRNDGRSRQQMVLEGTLLAGVTPLRGGLNHAYSCPRPHR